MEAARKRVLPKVNSNEVLRRFREQGLAVPTGTGPSGKDAEVQQALGASTLTRTETEKRCVRACAFVEEHMRLASCSLVDIFSADLYATLLPPAWRADLEHLTDAELSDLSAGKLLDCIRDSTHAVPGSLQAFLCEARAVDIGRDSHLLGSEDPGGFPLIAMTEKKAHEVRIMARVVEYLASSSGSTAVVDCGSGKGYLSEALAAGLGLRVVGVDAQAVNTRGALKRHAIVERLVTGKRRGRPVSPSALTVQDLSRPYGGGVALLQDGTRGGTRGFAAVTGKVDLRDRGALHELLLPRHIHGEIQQLVDARTESSEDGKGTESAEGLVAVGLHACGDLAATMLRGFRAEGRANHEAAEVRAIVVVGCCYNLLSEVGGETGPSNPPPIPGLLEPGRTGTGESGEMGQRGDCEAPKDTQLVGFPMSQAVRTQRQGRSPFGRNTFNLGCAPAAALPREAELQPNELNNMYRSAFQVLWLRSLKALAAPHLRQDKVVVGKIGAKSHSFHDYVTRALARLALPPDALTASEIALCWSTCLSRLPELRRLTAVRAVLARAVEALVLLDRAAFLLEVREELTSPPPAVVALLPLFDPVISPRSVAVVALRDDPIIAQNRPGCSPHEQA